VTKEEYRKLLRNRKAEEERRATTVIVYMAAATFTFWGVFWAVIVHNLHF
jgi:hypothetical protein